MATIVDRFALYERIVEHTFQGVWVIDADNQTTFVNRAMADMLGYPRDALVGMPMFDLMDDEGRRIAANNVERRKHGIAETHEFVFRRKDGRALWTRLATNPLHDPDGTYQGALALVTDLTPERSGAAEREHLWRILDESLNEIYIFRRADLRFVYGNRGALHNLGYTIDELRAMTPLDLKPDQTPASFAALVAPLVDGQRPRIEFRTVHRRRDGSTYPVEVHLQLMASAGEPAFVALINDISERIEAERLAHASELRFRALIEESPDLLLLLDEAGRCVLVSPSITTSLGYTPAELVGRPALDLVLEGLRADQEGDVRGRARVAVGADREPAADDVPHVRGGQRGGREMERGEHLGRDDIDQQRGIGPGHASPSRAMDRELRARQRPFSMRQLDCAGASRAAAERRVRCRAVDGPSPGRGQLGRSAPPRSWP